MSKLDHSIAKELFLEIRERPYRVSTKPFVPANNCFYKNSDLLVGLGQLGYEVRGRTAEMIWPDVIPEEIRLLEDKKHDSLHFLLK